MALAERKLDRRTEVDDLQMEVDALEAERHQLGVVLGWISRLVLRSVLLERVDLTMEAHGHLDYISERLLRQGGGGAPA